MAVEYKGHVIDITTSMNRDGWRWSYTIDGEHFTESLDRPVPDKMVAMAEAEREAKQKVDRL